MLDGLRSFIGQDTSIKGEHEQSTRAFNSLRTRAANTINHLSHNIPGISPRERNDSLDSPRSLELDSRPIDPSLPYNKQTGAKTVARQRERDGLQLNRRRSRSVPLAESHQSLRMRAAQLRQSTLADLRSNLSRLPSFQFSLPFSDPDHPPQTRSDMMHNMRDLADNMSMTSLENESRATAMKAENNRMRGLIDGLPKLSLPGATPDLPFAGLNSETKEINIVVLGGYRGSILRSTEDKKMLWIPVKVGLGLRKVDLELPLKPTGEVEASNTIFPDGMLTNIGPVDISKRLLRRLREQESKGFCKVHEFGYDWRLGGKILSDQMLDFLDSLSGPSLVIAHSLGGLITLHAMNRRPELFSGVLFAGTPFSGCPNILGPFRYGDGVLINRTILNPRTNFSMRSSFMLLPTHKRCFVDLETSKEIPIDFFDPLSWLEYGLSPEVAADHGAGDVGESLDVNGMIAGGGIGGPSFGRDTSGADTEDSAQGEANITRRDVEQPSQELNNSSHIAADMYQRPEMEYLKRTLDATLTFKSELNYRPSVSYPPLAILRSRSTPTVRGCSVLGAQGIKDGDYSKFIFSAGDGVVTYAASDLRLLDTTRNDASNSDEWAEHIVKDVENDRGHIGLLGDIEGVERCLLAILSHQRSTAMAVTIANLREDEMQVEAEGLDDVDTSLEPPLVNMHR